MIVHVVTEGSHWFMAGKGGQPYYLRMPLHEGPREEPYRSMSEGTVLEDLVWHPMQTWNINREGRLKIAYELPSGETVWIGAPGARIVDRIKGDATIP